MAVFTYRMAASRIEKEAELKAALREVFGDNKEYFLKFLDTEIKELKDVFSFYPDGFGDFWLKTARAVASELGILPIRKSKSEIKAKKPQKKVNLFLKDFEVGAVYNVKNHNPFWWNMPGTGEAYDVCGHLWDREFKACLNLSKHSLGDHAGKVLVRKKASSCKRFECPVCYVDAAVKEASRIVTRFMCMPKYNQVRDGYNYGVKNLVGSVVPYFHEVEKERVDTAEDRTPFGVPIHLMVSPSKEDSGLLVDAKGYEKLKSILREMLKLFKVNGGCIIFHPWRSRKENYDEYSFDVEKVLNGDYDVKSIKKYFKNMGKDFNEWYISPHFHIICYAKDGIDGDLVSKNFNETGWVVKNLGVRDSVMATAVYQLTHCGIHKNFHTVTWFGMMGYSSKYLRENGFDPEQHLGSKCSECGEYLKNYLYVGEDQAFLDIDEPGDYWVSVGVSHLKYFREVEMLRSDMRVEKDSRIDDSWEYCFIKVKEEKARHNIDNVEPLDSWVS